MNFIAYGKILKPHGLKGEIKLFPYSGNPENFKQVKHIYILSDTDGTQQHRVIAKKLQKNLIIAKIQNVNCVEDAELLRDTEVHVDRNELPPNQNDEYYWFELIGLNVYENENGKFIGNVDSLIDNTAHPILVIKNNSKEYMIPFINRFVKKIDLDSSKIVVESIAELDQ